MFSSGFLRKAKLAVMTTFIAAGSTVFSSCGWTDVRDNLVAGALDAVSGASENWISSLIIDMNEIFEATPDTSIDTP